MAARIVKRLERLGLLEAVRVEPRRGKPVRYYRAVADGFFVPYSAADVRVRLERTESHHRSRLVEDFQGTGFAEQPWGMWFWRDPNSEIHTGLHAPDTERAWNTLSTEAPGVLSR